MSVLQSRTLLVALVSCVITIPVATPVHAQAALLGPGAAFIGGGISRIGTRPLDDRLADRGYPTFGQSAGAVSLGAYRLLSSGVMLGFEWHGLLIGDKQHAGREVSVAGGYGTLGVAYVNNLTPRLRAYPRVGIGGGGLAVVFEEPADTSSFDDVLANPTPAPDVHDPVLGRDGVVFDVGAGIEFLPSGRRAGPILGLRLG